MKRAQRMGGCFRGKGLSLLRGGLPQQKGTLSTDWVILVSANCEGEGDDYQMCRELDEHEKLGIGRRVWPREYETSSFSHRDSSSELSQRDDEDPRAPLFIWFTQTDGDKKIPIQSFATSKMLLHHAYVG